MIAFLMMAALAVSRAEGQPSAGAPEAQAAAAAQAASSDIARLHRLYPNDVRYMTSDQLALGIVCADLFAAADELKRAHTTLQAASPAASVEVVRLGIDADAWSRTAAAEVEQYCPKPERPSN